MRSSGSNGKVLVGEPDLRSLSALVEVDGDTGVSIVGVDRAPRKNEPARPIDRQIFARVLDARASGSPVVHDDPKLAADARIDSDLGPTAFSREHEASEACWVEPRIEYALATGGDEPRNGERW